MVHVHGKEQEDGSNGASEKCPPHHAVVIYFCGQSSVREVHPRSAPTANKLIRIYGTKGQEAYEAPRPPPVLQPPTPPQGPSGGGGAKRGPPCFRPKPPFPCRAKKRTTRVKISGRFYCPQPLPCPWGGHSRHLSQGGGRSSPPTAPSPLAGWCSGGRLGDLPAPLSSGLSGLRDLVPCSANAADHLETSMTLGSHFRCTCPTDARACNRE